jgi:hypothetical protein
MMRKRMGADMTRNKSAAFSKTSSDSVSAFSCRGAVFPMVSFLRMLQMSHDCPAKNHLNWPMQT